MHLTVSNQMILSDVPDWLREEIDRTFRVVNPRWKENERLGRWNRNIKKYLSFYEKRPSGEILLPRGYTRRLIEICRNRGLEPRWTDRRHQLPETGFTFSGTLKPFQQKAVDAMRRRTFGTLVAPTGSGKTVIGLHMIALRRQPALVVVHTRDLADQWTGRIEEFLGIPAEAVGRIGGGEKRVGEQITVALIQSLYKCANEVAPRIGHLIVDECHRTPSRTFTEAVSAFDAQYMLGLTATPQRRDGLGELIFWYLGDPHYTIDKAGLVEKGHILDAEVVVRETAFVPFHDPTSEYPKMLSELTADDARNRLIASDVAREVEKGEGICLVLSDRKKHCELLQSLLRFKHHVEAELLTGDLSPARRRDVIDRVGRGEVRVLVATGQLIGEGFDCAGLTTLFIVTPVKFGGRLLQYMGRVLRPAPGKTRARIYDYVDVQVGPLRAAAGARQRVYRGNT